jgi:phage tail sheath protein FI
MPEYLAPGVYLEETSFRSKSIEGVSTTTTGFIGPCRYGPVTEPVDIITSLGEFERSYAGGGKLEFAGDKNNPTVTSETDNFLWHGVRAFFTEGGKRLYISRIFRPLDGDYPPNFDVTPNSIGTGDDLRWEDGHARAQFGDIIIRARFPGAASNIIVRLTAKAGQNILSFESVTGQIITSPLSPLSPLGPQTRAKLGAILDRDVVVILRGGSPAEENGVYLALFNPAEEDERKRWEFQPATQSPASVNLKLSELEDGDAIHVMTLTVNVLSDDREHDLGTWAGLPPDPLHLRAGVPDSLFDKFAPSPATLSEARTLPLVIARPDPEDEVTGTDVLMGFFSDLLSLTAEQVTRKITLTKKLSVGVTKEIQLTGGNDGLRPGSTEYEGKDDPERTFKTGLKQFEDVEDISIVAAPGCTADFANEKDEINAIVGLLINHAESMRYRIAVLDSPPDLSIADVREVRAKLDSKYAAFYYPWVTVLDPITRAELNLPPSGFVSGIYARNDIQRAVYKAPANEVVNLAIGFEQILNKAQQEVLNPEGINCFRFFEGRGFRLWGARTISSDPEWKYVNLRRYFAYLERSIDKGTQWAVFEPNGEALWANVRRTIEDFLLNEWQMGALLGEKPEKAYFVRCDRSTMTQNDLDNGRLVCLIGVAPLRPAEFVIFRIGQWTGDRKV